MAEISVYSFTENVENNIHKNSFSNKWDQSDLWSGTIQADINEGRFRYGRVSADWDGRMPRKFETPETGFFGSVCRLQSEPSLDSGWDETYLNRRYDRRTCGELKICVPRKRQKIILTKNNVVQQPRESAFILSDSKITATFNFYTRTRYFK